MNIVEFAHQIIDLEEEKNHWKREAMHYKHLYEQWSDMANKSTDAMMEAVGTVLLAALDEEELEAALLKAEMEISKLHVNGELE